MSQQSSQKSTTPLRLFEPPFFELASTFLSKRFVSGNIFTGDAVLEMEKAIATYLGIDRPGTVVAVSSGTKALEYIFRIARTRDFKVLVPSLTMAATPLALEAIGLVPKFVDVGPDLLVNLDILKEAMDEEVGAVCVVDYAGRLPDIDGIQKWTLDNGLLLFEDAAHSFGACRGGHLAMTGVSGAATSFHPVKALPGLGGGLFVCGQDSPRFEKEAQERRYYGITGRSGHDYDIKRWGENAYMSDLSAEVVMYFLGRVREHNETRRKLAKCYIDLLTYSNMDATFTPLRFDGGSTYHLFPVICAQSVNRDKVIKQLGEAGIQAGSQYIPCHWFTRWMGASKGPITHLESVGKRILILPCHLGMTGDDVERVLRALAVCAWD